MKRMRDVHIEDAVTARMTLRHPEIRRIGVKAYARGWRCYQVWTVRGAPPPSYEGRRMLRRLSSGRARLRLRADRS